VSDKFPPTPRDPGDDPHVRADPGAEADPPQEPHAAEDGHGAPRPYRPHRPAKPPQATEPAEREPWYDAADEPDFPHHTGAGGHDPVDAYFTPNPPNVPYFPGTAPRRTLDRTTALVAALVLTGLLALAGWSTAALALTRDRSPARTAAGPPPTPAAPAASSEPPTSSLAEAPCGPAATAAERQGLTELRSTPSATLDGTGSSTELRLKLRCTLSSEQVDLSVDLLRSPDTDAVDEFFDFHRRSALGGTRSTGLPELGERAFVTVDEGAAGGRTTIGVDVAGNRRALSIVGTTSGDFAVEEAQTLLVAIAKAYLAAR
jgi:hypothetical protein